MIVVNEESMIYTNEIGENIIQFNQPSFMPLTPGKRM
jgi:hypothetical protein